MSKYNDAYKKAKKEGKIKNLTPEFFKWDKAGDIIVGRYISQQVVEGGQSGTPYNQYLFDTDKGVIKFALGSNADKEFATRFEAGKVYAIEYKGQVEVGQGRRVNKFNVDELTDIVIDEPADDLPM